MVIKYLLLIIILDKRDNDLFSFYQEYSEDSNSEPDVDLENQYYNSKALKEDDPKAALQSFQKVLDLEGGDKGEWGFKALKQMIKINFKLVSAFYNFFTKGIIPLFNIEMDFNFHDLFNYFSLIIRR